MHTSFLGQTIPRLSNKFIEIKTGLFLRIELNKDCLSLETEGCYLYFESADYISFQMHTLVSERNKNQGRLAETTADVLPEHEIIQDSVPGDTCLASCCDSFS